MKIFEKNLNEQKIDFKSSYTGNRPRKSRFLFQFGKDHHSGARGAYLVKIYFHRKYAELYTKRKLSTREKRKNWLWSYLTPSYSAKLRIVLIYH